MSTREDFEAWAKGVDLPIETDEHECFVDARVGIAANAYQAATSHQDAKIKALVEALEGLMLWQVRNVKVWHTDAYDQAVVAIQKAKETS